MKRLLAILLAVSTSGVSQQQGPTFSLTTSVVVVNVTVTDRNGKPVENLGAQDFQLFEDGKLQRLQSVDFQRLSTEIRPLGEPLPTAPKGYRPEAESSSLHSQFQDRRLMVLLFDLSSMQPAEQMRAKEAALQFLTTQLTRSDNVAIMSYGVKLTTVQDFTSDRDALVSAIQRLRIGDSSENAATADTGPDAQDQSGQFTADETEFNIFNADLKLAALEDAARALGKYPEKKALIYISSGIQKNGVDNQSQLQATVNTAVRANVAFYPIDARGLSAMVPGGDASQQGASGTGLYNGSGQRSGRENFNNQQETLASLALDTGGKALLDSNDLAAGMRQVQQDFSSYYVLSYVSTNTATDGRYRRIQVKLAPRDTALKAKLDYRPGYFGPTTFGHMSESDKEAQLSQALNAENPVTDLPMAVEVDHFRLDRSKYFVPISVRIPASSLVFNNKGGKQSTALDFIAELLDAHTRNVATVRDEIPLAVVGSTQGKNIQYDTGVTLAPGAYKLRFVARENAQGKIGTYEHGFVVPDLGSVKSLRTSSLIVSNQRQALSGQTAAVKNDKKVVAANPLVQDGLKLVPNVTRVFRAGQTLLAYVEVYDPATPDFGPGGNAMLQARLDLFQNGRKVLETPVVRGNRPLAGRPGTFPIWINASLNGVAPGNYESQVTVIDPVGQRVAFERLPIAVLPAER